MSKYDRLRRYLESQAATTSSVVLDFREIEGILGDGLPPSARRHTAWWANTASHSHTIWLEAGWETSKVDMASGRVTFVRTGLAKPERAPYAIPDTGAGEFRARRKEPGHRIGLIACTKAKLTRPAPARELYSASDLFRKAAAYCDAYLDGWFVLSAKYGLVEPERIIAPYDMTLKTMPASERRRWGTQVVQRLRQLGDVALEAHAGAAYVRPLLEAGIVLDDPVRGLTIGKRKRWYIERLGRAKG
jgi:hypothetical protein